MLNRLIREVLSFFVNYLTRNRMENITSYIDPTVHEKKKPFTCFICNYQCSQRGNMTNHIASVHEGKKPFKCSICDYKFSTKQMLTKHTESVHEGRKPYSCSICVFCGSIKRPWLSTLDQFMRARNHSNVPFVITTLHKWGTLKCILYQCMRARNPSNVQFVTTVLESGS